MLTRAVLPQGKARHLLLMLLVMEDLLLLLGREQLPVDLLLLLLVDLISVVFVLVGILLLHPLLLLPVERGFWPRHWRRDVVLPGRPTGDRTDEARVEAVAAAAPVDVAAAVAADHEVQALGGAHDVVARAV